MNYLWQHLEHILAAYDGRLPLHHFLKSYFAQHKKLGSRDRRGLSDAVYAWYRAGKMFAHDVHSLREQRLAAMRACGMKPKAFAAAIDEQLSNGHTDVHAFHGHEAAIFPHDIPLCVGISIDVWRSSMLFQPRLFLRIRKEHKTVESALSDAGIYREWRGKNCVCLPNGTNVEGLLSPDAYVVQDASSQETGNWFQPNENEAWWDVCSGAGGKSLMLLDAVPRLHLTVSDIRPSILKNLVERFRKYGHKMLRSLVLDAADSSALSALGNQRFDGIICDVPCSGSGTWARTPEACYFFEPQILEHYTSRQKAILRNAAAFLKEEGRLFYITCSVFRAENEGVLEEVVPQAGLRIVASHLINGVEGGASADSLFISELRRAGV